MTSCAPDAKKPTLDAAYLDAHQPIAYNTPEMKDAYAVLGYAAIVQIFDQLRERLAKDRAYEAEQLPLEDVTVQFTVDTTWRAGGCMVVCVKSSGTCIHQHRAILEQH
ncbi:hypothetical protein [Parvularcula dongshanensis]|uniref:Uncharacterized protein n=1 Tax=Parvularcula dongshanensis TaxID=1173995 RepID=A0A840I1J6_9PROT|nr:hypothetical protein [Parvularcula dongshanensis]MBB4658153.1 hypothetical protein [Parvularcula dongshanensis]